MSSRKETVGGQLISNVEAFTKHIISPHSIKVVMIDSGIYKSPTVIAIRCQSCLLWWAIIRCCEHPLVFVDPYFPAVHVFCEVRSPDCPPKLEAKVCWQEESAKLSLCGRRMEEARMPPRMGIACNMDSSIESFENASYVWRL